VDDDGERAVVVVELFWPSWASFFKPKMYEEFVGIVSLCGGERTG
jgi:hypothetical protein